MVAAVVLATASALLLAAVPLLFGAPLPMIHVRWEGISQAERLSLEQRFRLTEGAPLGGEVWAYVPADISPDTLRAIVTHASAADTDGINRRTFEIADRPPLTPRRGGLIAGAPPWMARAVRASALAIGGLGALLLAGALATLLLPVLRRTVRVRTGSPVRWRLAPTPRSAQWLAMGAITLVAVAWRFLTFTGFSNDHYAHLVMAQQVLLGDRPIRDFADPGWPLTYTLTALGWAVTGKTMATEWVISTLGFAIGAACTVAAASRLSGSLAIAVAVTVIEILVFPRAYSYPKILIYAAAGWALLPLTAGPSTRRLVLMALLVAIAFLFRHDHGLFIGLAAAVGVAVTSRDLPGPAIFRRLALLTGATALFLLPWIVFVMLNGGLFSYLEAGLDYSRAEADATQLGSLPWSGAEAWLFWVYWAVAVACGMAAITRLVAGRQRWAGESAAIVALAVCAVLVNASFLRESLEVRVPDAIVPAALLGAWALGLCWSMPWRRVSAQRAVRIASVILVLVTGIAAARVAGIGNQYEDAEIGNGIAGLRDRTAEVWSRLQSQHRDDVPSRYSLALRPFFDYIDRCTSPADRLIVTGEFPDVLVLAGRRFAGDGIVFGSWYASVTHQDRTLVRLRADPALFVLHMGDYESFQRKYGQIETYVNASYRPMAEVEVDEGGTIRILVDKARQQRGVDAATGWPCFR
jgi:hypothetical protein